MRNKQLSLLFCHFLPLEREVTVFSISVFPLKGPTAVVNVRKFCTSNFINTQQVDFFCCGATEGSEQQHNQDLKEIYKGRWILEFITFYHNALHLTRVHCGTNNSNENMGGWESASFAAQTQSFLCGKFSTARLEVLPNFKTCRSLSDEYNG